MRRYFALFLVFFLLSGRTIGRAQTTAHATLFGLDVSAFPTISAALDVFDASGSFVTGLTTGQVTLLEDNISIAPTLLQELQPGTQFAVALDPGRSFAFRDSNAVTRLEKVVGVLQNWSLAHADSLGDDLSLLPTGGIGSTHLASGVEFAGALAAYQPDLQTLVPNLDTLSISLDIVSDPGPQLGMKRVVLYIGSPPEAASVAAIQNLTQRAVEQDVRVHVWIVGSEDFFSTSGATALKDLAIRTGGQYSLFTGAETLPDPETYLAPLRHGYTLTYPSAIRTTGSHTLLAQVANNAETLTSNPLSFDLNVQPPNPILVTPPEQVVRQGPEPRATDFSTFLPAAQEIDAIIEFTDGYSRPLARTTLYVDGILADENLAEPFDKFTWGLEDYVLSGEHTLQVEAVDSLGLSSVSLGVKVTVTVVQPERGFLPFLARNSLWVVLGAVGVAGLALVSTFLASRKRGEKSPAQASNSFRRKAGSGLDRDPLTQPVEPASAKSLRNRLRPHLTQGRHVDAYLLRIKDDGQAITTTPIPITSPEMTFGSDPIQATRVLDDPSISPLHARLKEQDGHFVLSDEKSIAGTWVNYEMVNSPRILQHNDILHFGRIAYRFLLRKPPEKSAPRVIQVKK